MNKPKKAQFTIDECYLMMFSEYDDIVTADEAACMLRLPKKRIYRMFRSGETKSFKDGRDVHTVLFSGGAVKGVVPARTAERR